MKRWVLLLGLVLACGDSSDETTGTISPAGGSAGAAGAGGAGAGGSGGGGASGAGPGGQGPGGAGGGGASAGGSGAGGAAGSDTAGAGGQAGATQCGNGAPFPELPPEGKACSVPDDCTFYVRLGCCGNDYIGLAKKGSDAFVAQVTAWQSTCPECGPLGCASFDHAEDGTMSQTSPSTPKLLCQASKCTTSFGP